MRQTETGARAPIEWTQTKVLSTLWAACAVFVPLVAIAAIAVEAVPHVRGIAFLPQLRYALLAPACGISAVAMAFLHQYFKDHLDNPRRALGASLLTFSVVVLMLMGMVGPPGLLAAGAPAVLVTAVVLDLLVPRFLDHPPGRVGIVAIVLFGALEMAGVVGALKSEKVSPPGLNGMAFDIPRAVFDADHKFIDLSNGARIHYVDEGKGETILFLHGNPAWSFQWRDLIGGLRGSFRCVALDYPGFGLSSAPAGYGFTPREQSLVLEEFVDRLGLHDLTLVMQDWGGPIGIGLMERRPELVRRVVLGNTWAWPTTTKEGRGKFSKIAGGPIGEFAQMNFNTIAGAATKLGIVRELPSDVAEMYLRPFVPIERRGVAAFYPGQITAALPYFTELEAGLSRLGDRKALIFWGMRDPGMPPAELEHFEKVFPNHKTFRLENANHFFFEDAAPLIVAQIASFVSADSKQLTGVK